MTGGTAGSPGSSGRSCLAPRPLEPFSADALLEELRVDVGVGRRFEIVNSGEALPELPMTTQTVNS